MIAVITATVDSTKCLNLFSVWTSFTNITLRDIPRDTMTVQCINMDLSLTPKLSLKHCMQMWHSWGTFCIQLSSARGHHSYILFMVAQISNFNCFKTNMLFFCGWDDRVASWQGGAMQYWSLLHVAEGRSLFHTVSFLWLMDQSVSLVIFTLFIIFSSW